MGKVALVNGYDPSSDPVSRTLSSLPLPSSFDVATGGTFDLESAIARPRIMQRLWTSLIAVLGSLPLSLPLACLLSCMTI